MKYVFLAIGFFSLGYALPGLPSFVQLAAAIFIGLLILFALYLFINSLAYPRIIE